MFLKTVPPLVAVHSEWRSGKSLSLPLCFNDSASDSDFVSSSGAPIPHKVQMIIDSLCSSQSSDMSGEVTANAQSALNLPNSSCSDMSCHMDTLERSQRAATESSKLPASGSVTDGSDSDDSVDRGIEEAIQEYLKEKVDHNIKREPIESPVQTVKGQQEGNYMPDAPKQLMHSTKVLPSRNHTLKGSKGIQPLADLKKKKKTIKDHAFRKTSATKSLLTKAPPSSGTTTYFPEVDCTPNSLRITVDEEDLMNSSSDDGIEEAIQKFQEEEKERHKTLRYFQDSSSDDGIEEAIRSYQQERQEKKVHKLHRKRSCLKADHITVKPLKKLAKKKNQKKNAVEPKEIECVSPKSVGLSLSMLPTCYLSASGDTLCSSRAEEPRDGRHIHSTLTVNTTAELMCAEAILDISKTVMPAAFEPTLDLASNPTTETQAFLLSGVSQYEKRDESSVDSEDGIEQEIRQFLELKAKLHEQATDYHGGSTITKTPQHNKVEESQSKALSLSFSRKRKRKEVVSMSKQGIASNKLKEEPQLKPLTQTDFFPVSLRTCSPYEVRNSDPTQNSANHSITEGSTSTIKGCNCGTSLPMFLTGSERNYCSDKSSSLDSDEDLDAAIKDLLKTKKKVKKKVRDMKLKQRKGPKLMQTPGTGTMKKLKSVNDQKLVLAAKPMKPTSVTSSKGLMNIAGQYKSEKTKGLKLKNNNKKSNISTKLDQGPGYNMTVHVIQSTHVCEGEESSSVDSDDSIEQEIRRFLAEKAKVSSKPLTTLNQDDAGGAEEATFNTYREIKVETEEVQIVSSDLGRGSLSIDPNQEVQTKVIAMNFKGPASTLATQCSLEEDNMGDQLHERTCRKISLNTDKDLGQKETQKFTDRTDSEPFVINVSDPQEFKGEAQHQNLFLMKHDNFSISTDKDKSSADLSSSLQNRSTVTLTEAISPALPPRSLIAKHLISSSSETLMVAKGDCQESPAESRSDTVDHYSWESNGQWDQPPNLTSNTRHTSSNSSHLSCQQPPYPSHLSCVPLPLALSQPHVGTAFGHHHRDQVSAVALSAHKSSHLRNIQKDTRIMSEGREEEQERCIDETDVESGEGSTEKRPQQCSQ